MRYLIILLFIYLNTPTFAQQGITICVEFTDYDEYSINFGSFQYEMLDARKSNKQYQFRVDNSDEIIKMIRSINELDCFDICEGKANVFGKMTIRYPNYKKCIYIGTNSAQIGLFGLYYKLSEPFKDVMNEISLKYTNIKMFK